MLPDSSPIDKTPDRITPGKALEPDKPLAQPASSFESYMQDSGGQAKGTAPTSGANQVASVRSPAMQTAGPTFDTLIGQARNAQDGLGTIGQQLQTPNLKLKRSQAHLLKNKLQDTNEYAQAAADKLDVATNPLQVPAGASPIGRFLAYVGHGQDQMESIQGELKRLASSNTEIQPGAMLFIQVKMSQAQQEIEYSTTLLGKVIDSIKQIMNTQL